MSLRIVTAPAAFPVTLAEAKEWCRIDAGDTSQDGVLNLVIAMAVKAAEHITGRAFVERTYELALSQFEATICLPFPPLLEVVSVAYTDINADAQAVDPAIYEVDVISEPGRVQPRWRQFWPIVTGLGYTFNPVRITYRAGYRPMGSPTDLTDNSYLPPELRLWMQSRLCSFYDNRAQFVIDTRLVDVQVPRDFADGILDSLIVGTRYF
jgi:uncharacterized phiE125 gp8 family phage protein